MRILFILVILFSSVVINTVVVSKTAQASQCQVWYIARRTTMGHWNNVIYPGTNRIYEDHGQVYEHYLSWFKSRFPDFHDIALDEISGDPKSF